MTGDLLDAAVRNNAEWCDLVCRTHGITGGFAADAWTSSHRTPSLYPDAVTLTPTVDVNGLLARVDATVGCSVKDSFATLDLTPHGFHVRFDAQWIAREPSTSAHARDARWQPVRDADALATWERAWDPELSGLFLPALLDEHAVTVLAALENDQIVAGAITNRSATVVGISNVFDTTGNPDDAWSGCLTSITQEHPDVPVVGYEPEGALTTAHAHGFTALGPLRIWVRES